jgi:hypothetical protein
MRLVHESRPHKCCPVFTGEIRWPSILSPLALTLQSFHFHQPPQPLEPPCNSAHGARLEVIGLARCLGRKMLGKYLNQLFLALQPITDHRSPTINHQPQTTNHRPDHRPPSAVHRANCFVFPAHLRSAHDPPPRHPFQTTLPTTHTK